MSNTSIRTSDGSVRTKRMRVPSRNGFGSFARIVEPIRNGSRLHVDRPGVPHQAYLIGDLVGERHVEIAVVVGVVEDGTGRVGRGGELLRPTRTRRCHRSDSSARSRRRSSTGTRSGSPSPSRSPRSTDGVWAPDRDERRRGEGAVARAEQDADRCRCRRWRQPTSRYAVAVDVAEDDDPGGPAGGLRRAAPR